LRLPELAIPGFCGPIDEFYGGLHYWGAGLFDRGFPLVVSLYLGVSVLFLAFIGWIRSGDDPTWRRLRALFTALTGISVVLALGAHLPLLGRAWAVVPGLDVVRFPVKMLLMAGLPVALLAGRGCDRWFGGGAASARRFGLAAVAAAVCCGAAAGWLSLDHAHPLLEWLFPGRGGLAGDGLPPQVAAAAVVLAACGAIGLAAGRVRQPLLAAGAAVVVVGDLFMASVPVLLTAPKRVLAETPVAVEDVRRALSGGRFYRDTDGQGPEMRLTEDRAWESTEGFIRGISFSVASTFMVPMVLNEDIAGLADRRMARLSAEVERSELPELLQVFQVAAVEAIATENRLDHPELELVKVFPRADGIPLTLYRFRPGSEVLRWVASQRETLSGAKALETLMDPGFDAHTQVVREVRSPKTRRRSVPWTGLAPRAEVLRGRVVAPEDGFLAIAVPWHRDLEVRDNGVLVGAERLNYAFVGFPVESGLHDVRVEFVSRRVLAGGLTTAVSVMIWLAFAFTSWRPSRPHGAHSSISSGRASSPR
jgi:hypothetical protein